MKNPFGSVKLAAPKVNKFDLTHTRKFSCNLGQMIPVLCRDVVPGDRIRLSTELLIRFAPMLAPVMHMIDCRLHAFYVPTRIMWDEATKFFAGGRLGTETPPVHPYLRLQQGTDTTVWNRLFKRSLADYLGMPTNDLEIPNETCAEFDFSALPFRGYQMIYDEFFRDQNVTAALDISKASGEVTGETEILKHMNLRTAAWEKDYFTSALPFAQRGTPVGIPVTGAGSVTYKPTSDLLKTDGTTLAGQWPLEKDANHDLVAVSTGPVNNTMRIENIDTVSLSSVSVLVEELRISNRMQEFLERMAVGGARYTEYLRAVHNVTSSDRSLQRPEYLGGMKSKVVISEVLSTVETATLPQGEMAGHGVSVGGSHLFSRFFEEFGYVYVIMTVRPRTAYQEGLATHWTRFTREEYFIPQFVNLGEQVIKNKELFLDYDEAGEAANEGDFGYQSRYADYKYIPSTVHGDFRDNLAFWHMGRIFGSLPVLNTEFIECNPTYRIFAVDETTETDHLWVLMTHHMDALRPLPFYSQPSI